MRGTIWERLCTGDYLGETTAWGGCWKEFCFESSPGHYFYRHYSDRTKVGVGGRKELLSGTYC